MRVIEMEKLTGSDRYKHVSNVSRHRMFQTSAEGEDKAKEVSFRNPLWNWNMYSRQMVDIDQSSSSSEKRKKKWCEMCLSDRLVANELSFTVDQKGQDYNNLLLSLCCWKKSLHMFTCSLIFLSYYEKSKRHVLVIQRKCVHIPHIIWSNLKYIWTCVCS